LIFFILLKKKKQINIMSWRKSCIKYYHWNLQFKVRK
jgi:hypothetical protein